MIRLHMSGRFRFGDFELDVAAYALRQNGLSVKLEKIPMDVLILLVRKAGILVNRAEIQAALWGPDVFVEHDSGINTAVRKIRRALGDDSDRPRFLETVVGKGYRFIAPVRPDGGAGAVPSDRARRHRPNHLLTRGKQEFVLERGENLLGRDAEARVYVDHRTVSRFHARISIESDAAILEDLNSRNGTFLDGRKIEIPTEIHHGAIIGLGLITFTYLVQPDAASTLPMGDGSDRTGTTKS